MENLRLGVSAVRHDMMSSILAGGAKTRQTPGEFGGFTYCGVLRWGRCRFLEGVIDLNVKNCYN